MYRSLESLTWPIPKEAILVILSQTPQGSAVGINPRGDIIGNTQTSSGSSHAFLASKACQ
jgi:probable HAF family extracellular repeat protein